MKGLLNLSAVTLILVAAVGMGESACGGLLEGRYGRFRYSAANSTDTNKTAACIWVIHANGASGIEFQVNDLGGDNAVVTIYHHLGPAGTCSGPLRINASKGYSYTFQEDTLVVIVSVEVTTVSFEWNPGMQNSTRGNASTVDYVQTSDGSLVWRPNGMLETFTFVLADLNAPVLAQWNVKADLGYCDATDPCSCFNFAAFQISNDGYLVDIVRACGQSGGDFRGFAAPLVIFGAAGTSVPGNAEIELGWSVARNESVAVVTSTTTRSTNFTSPATTAFVNLP